MGIKPPKGVILYGPPGTGKTLLAKAVANQTSATFLRVVGSELIQKYLGDGPKMVRELFRVAEEHAPVRFEALRNRIERLHNARRLVDRLHRRNRCRRYKALRLEFGRRARDSAYDARAA